MLEFVMQLLQGFINGVLGKNRREKYKLTERLRAERTEYDRLAKEQEQQLRTNEQLIKERDRISKQYSQTQREHQQLQRSHNQLTSQHTQLQQAYKQLEHKHHNSEGQQKELEKQLANAISQREAIALERDKLVEMAAEDERKLNSQLSEERSNIAQLRRKKTSLEAKLSNCLYRHAPVANAEKSGENKDKTATDNSEPEALNDLNLEDFAIAIVGGHDSLRQYIIEELKQKHSVRKNNIRELSAEHSSDHGRVKDKIQHCHFVFIITESISHRLGNAVMDLRNKGALEGEVIRLDKTGHHSVLSTMLKHIADQMN